MTDRQSSYRQILRATSLIGVASGINVIFQVVRVKVLAVLLGPSGMGLFGMYYSIMSTASSLAGMGISSSAVRQIAEARSQGNEQRIGEVVYVFRVLTIGLGAIGATALFILREPIAQWTFGHTENAAMVGWLAIGVFISVASQSLSALLQGYRRIGDQARLQVWSGAASTLLAIGAIAWLGKEGIIIFVVAMPFIVMLLAWFYARRVGLTVKRVEPRVFGTHARRLISLGITIMAAGVLQGWALLALRSHITQNLGLDATGLFQAAWALSFVYMSFVLEAMGRDYYPHLTEHVADRQKAVQLMREQVNVAIILIGPLLIGMIAFSPIIVDLLYAHSFRDAVPLMQWMGLGNFLKVISWPLAFVLLAQSRPVIFIALEIMWIGSFLGIAWLAQSIGLHGVGIAFMGAYALYLFVLYWVSRLLIGFSFNSFNLRLLIGYGTLTGSVFLSAQYNFTAGYIVGALAMIVALLTSYTKLKHMLNKDPLRLLLDKFIVK